MPCRTRFPHERSLAERYEDKPFVILGINGDGDLAVARKAATREALPYRSFWDGADGPDGPIARAWQPRSWPMAYVIDADGVLRHKSTGGEAADAAIARWVAAAEKAATEAPVKRD